ncbi:13104_t:CDS:2, partial [Funneliformis geosporum]
DLSINEWDIIIVQVESLFRIEFTGRPFVAILDEANAIMRQMSSGTNARESKNAIRDVLRSARHVLAMDAFANISTLTFLQIYRGENIRIVDNKYQPRIGETVEFIYDPNSGAEAMRIGYDLLRQGKRVAFVSTGAVMARALVEKASKLSKPDNSPVKAPYTNTVEAGISFEITGHFDIVIAIINIATPVHVEAFAQMLYRICDCPRRIVSMFYQKNSNELFRPPGRENIRAELESARPNNLPTAIKGHLEHQKRLSARYFIEKLCSLIASTGASLQLIKMDESRGVIGNHTMALKRFYMRNIYGKDIDNEIWDNLCNKKFVKHFSPPEPRKHFLQLSHSRKQGYDEESAMKGLEAKDIAQWEDSHY